MNILLKCPVLSFLLIILLCPGCQGDLSSGGLSGFSADPALPPAALDGGPPVSTKESGAPAPDLSPLGAELCNGRDDDGDFEVEDRKSVV